MKKNIRKACRVVRHNFLLPKVLMVSLIVILSFSSLFVSCNDTLTLQSIKVTTKPASEYQYLGKGLDKTGMVVTGHYSNGTESVISDYTVSPEKFETLGINIVTVSYQGKTDSFEVNVIDGSSGSTYKITYDGNENTGGTAPAAQTDCIYGADVTLAENTGSLGRTDYVFAGWNTKADGTGTSYAAGETVPQGFTVDTTLYAKWLKLNPIGGRVFYMHDDNGAAYTFYDSSKNAFNEATLVQKNTGDVNAIRNMDKNNNWNKVAYYTVDNKGKNAADKFYVYDNKTRTNSRCNATDGLAHEKTWGRSKTEIGRAGVAPQKDGIGQGWYNTEACLGKSGVDWTDKMIFGYVKNMREYDSGKGVGDCNDWFIPSKQELEMLRASGLVSRWFNTTFLWSSVEKNYDDAWFWVYYGARFIYNFKYYWADVVAMRAF